MRNKIGTICMGIGAVCLLGALLLFLYNEKEAKEAEQYSEAVMPLLVEAILENAGKSSGTENSAESGMGTVEETGEGQFTAGDHQDNSSEGESTVADPYSTEMTEVEIEGEVYIGYLSIPSLELELPVISQWSEKRLKKAICRYYGSTKTDDLVIAGHNYRKHFTPLSSLRTDDSVYFTDMDGIIIEYRVAAIEVLEATDIAGMTEGLFDLTLFTCTYNGEKRLTIRCTRVE